MPIVGSAYSSLLQSNIDSSIGGSPLGQADPSNFIKLCDAIGTGFETGLPTITINATGSGSKALPPIAPSGGPVVGIIVDAPYMQEQLYTEIRNNALAMFGETANPPFPPSPGGDGDILSKFCLGIANATKDHFATAWSLTLTSSEVYSGTAQIKPGDIPPLPVSTIASAIELAGGMAGAFWGKLCLAIATGVSLGLEGQGTSLPFTLSGTCVPGPSQVCGLPTSSGVAVGIGS